MSSYNGTGEAALFDMPVSMYIWVSFIWSSSSTLKSLETIYNKHKIIKNEEISRDGGAKST